AYLKPFWKLIVVSVVLTLFYILFNNLSLWVSVDFIRELFDPQNVEAALTVESDSPMKAIPGTEPDAKDPVGRQSLQEGGSAYQKINQAIKQFIIQDNRFDTLKIVCLVIFFSYLLKNIIFYLRRVLNSLIELKIILNLRNDLYKTIIRLPISHFERQHTGKLTSIAFNDVSSVNVVLTSTFGKLILTPLQILANLAILVMISWKLSLITFLIVPVAGYVIVKIGQSIRRRSRRVFSQIANVMAVFQESVSSIRIVKAFTNEGRQEKTFWDATRMHFKLLFRANRLSFLSSPLTETLSVLLLITLLWYGGNKVYTGAGLSAEDFMRYLVFLFTIFQPLKELSGLNNRIQTGMSAAERIFHILDENKEVYDKPGAKKLTGFGDSIVFDAVSFRYNEEDQQVLHDINLTIERGEMVAFVGPSGAGKSTLVDLIPRFYDLGIGSISIDGTDVQDYSLHSLRKQIGVVTQESILFNDTVKMNIAYGLDGVSDEQIVEAAKSANALEFILNMEDGMETVIGEKGVKLSGGQKQRLSIARAIFKNPPILILDEATSALDSESERLVQEAIDKLMKNRTVLVIAHRLSTIIHADKIVCMNRGRIEGIGSHEILLNDSSTYRRLYEIQFRHQLRRAPVEKGLL
ncbi:MAG: ABC transporter ATP-binding protein, partial [bacterium]